MTTKGDLVLLALRKAGIASSSSLIKPTAAMLDDYLGDLDNLMAYLDGVMGIRLGYMFSDPEFGGNLSDDTGLPDWAVSAIALQLAVQIMTDRNKPVKQSVQSQAVAMLSALRSRITKPKRLKRTSIMFRGAGWKAQNNYRFYHDDKPELETSDGQIIIE